MRKIISGILWLLLANSLVFSQSNIYNPTEFEKNEGVLLVWDYSPSRDSITANIAKAVQQTAQVWIIYYPESAPADTAEIRAYLYSRGVLPMNLSFIPGYTETLWIRDFGPMILYGDFGQGAERFVMDAGYSAYGRPKDDSLPSQIANLWSWEQQQLDLEIEGGNLIFDGLSRGFASKRVFDQNPQYTPEEIKNQLIQKFNLQDFVFMESLDNSGGGIWKHVDMFMKILDYETIMVSSYPEYVPDYAVVEENVDLLSGLYSHFGKPYEIIRIPAPPKADGSYATSWDDEMRTYTNSLTINNTVIVPSYGLPECDQQAYAIYRDAMPGYKIIMVDAQMLTILGGAIHCITREVPAENFMRIIHKKVLGSQDYSQDYYLYCLTESIVPIDSLWLHYKINDGYFQRVPVYIVCPQYTGIIEGLLPNDTVHYYFEAESGDNSTTYPLSAPAGYYSFWFNGVDLSEKKASFNTVNIVPQPGNGDFTLYEFDAPIIKQLRIFNVQGQEVWSVKNTQEKSFSTGLKPGTYMIVIETIAHTFRAKLIVSS
ncbi:MAG: agmatine deiminase family protein [Bacteroidetes bacterium]|nr:agmatine deiminase family protein [Bacteroidota bacterium]MBU1578504.1 agmatine deiminase family protein [Bacteroidota bacterium]MBU2464821.1 agmatine deiminase family protein [Bacteroidota bacterium]MBU2556532.1 agmatine deiminase family protein [Bacteroidota bacterium]